MCALWRNVQELPVLSHGRQRWQSGDHASVADGVGVASRACLHHHLRTACCWSFELCFRIFSRSLALCMQRNGGCLTCATSAAMCTTVPPNLPADAGACGRCCLQRRFDLVASTGSTCKEAAHRCALGWQSTCRAALCCAAQCADWTGCGRV
jgi:hypothetical protein